MVPNSGKCDRPSSLHPLHPIRSDRTLATSSLLAAIADFRREIDERLGQYSAHENAASVGESPISPSTAVYTLQQVQQLQEEVEQLRPL